VCPIQVHFLRCQHWLLFIFPAYLVLLTMFDQMYVHNSPQTFVDEHTHTFNLMSLALRVSLERTRDGAVTGTSPAASDRWTKTMTCPAKFACFAFHPHRTPSSFPSAVSPPPVLPPDSLHCGTLPSVGRVHSRIKFLISLLSRRRDDCVAEWWFSLIPGVYRNSG